MQDQRLFLGQLKGIRIGNRMMAVHGRPPGGDVTLVLPAHFARTRTLMRMVIMAKRMFQAN